MTSHVSIPQLTKAALTALVIGTLGTQTSCGKVSEGSSPLSETTSAAAPGVEVAEKVSIRGQVMLAGGRPASAGAVVDVGSNPFCSAHGAIVDPAWTVGAGGELANAVVRVLGAPRSSNLPDEPVLIDQRDCVFQPYVMVVQAGQKARIHNDDETFHNVRIALHEVGTRSGGKNLDNFGQPSKGFESIRSFDKPGVYRLECDVHRWMKCWVVAHENAHVTVTGNDGRFEIGRELADGDYVVEVWHPQFPEVLSSQVRVSNGQGTVSFTFELANAFTP